MRSHHQCTISSVVVWCRRRRSALPLLCIGQTCAWYIHVRACPTPPYLLRRFFGLWTQLDQAHQAGLLGVGDVAIVTFSLESEMSSLLLRA